MGRTWTESATIKYLNAKKDGKTLIIEGGTRGLTGCSAVDYLKNYCGYTIVLR